MRHVHRHSPLASGNASGPGLSQPSERTYVDVQEEGVTACLSVEPMGGVVFAEGLLWRDGRVLEEFSGVIHLQGRTLEEALRAAIARPARGPHRPL